MAFTMPNYPMLTPEQANPYHAAIQTALQQMQQVPKAVYAAPMSKQALQKAIQENQWNPKIWQSEIGLRGAQAGLAGQQAQMQQFLRGNPQYISPAGMLISQALRNGGQMQGGGAPAGMGGGGGNPPAGMGAQPSQGAPQGGQDQGQGGQPPMQQQPQQGAQGGQQGEGYDPAAYAYTPPNLGSPTGNSSLDPFYYKTFGMSPLVQAQLDLQKQQAQKYMDVSIDRNNEFNQQATAANESSMQANNFLSALDQVSSAQIGPYAGRTTAVQDAAQKLEKSHARLTESAARMFKPGQAIHDSDLALENLATPSRLQNREVSADLAHGIIAKNDRLKERQMFYAAGTTQGIKPQVLDAMWNKYETERPYINTDTYMPNDAYKGTWKDYLAPQAVNTYLRGQNYTPSDQKILDAMNWKDSDLKSLRNWALKNGKNPHEFDKKNLYAKARKYGMSLSQIKMKLMSGGALNVQ